MSKPASRPHLVAVDDDPEIRALYQELFAEAGYRVTSSARPLSADNGRCLAPDLILVDRPYRGDFARTIIAELRNHPSTATLPIIVSTTGRLDEVREELPADPALRLLAKPFDIDTLLTMADDLLAQSRALTVRSHDLRRRMGLARDRLRDLSG
jgi:CheY-like chemotaxis protein